MTLYDSRKVYPSGFDEVDLSDCKPDCTFECGQVGMCLKTCGENYIVCKLLSDKGYIQANIDWGFIDNQFTEGIELYKRQVPKFIENMERLGYSCTEYHHPLQKKYLSTVIIIGHRPIDIAYEFLKLDVIK